MTRMRWPNQGGGGSQQVSSLGARQDPDTRAEYVTYDEMLRAVGTMAGAVEGILRRGGHPEGRPATIEDLRRAHRAQLAGSDKSPSGTPLTWTDVVYRAGPDQRVLLHDWSTFTFGDVMVEFRDEAGHRRWYWSGDVQEYVAPDRGHPRFPDAVMARRGWRSAVDHDALSYAVVAVLVDWIDRGWRPSWAMCCALGDSAARLIGAGVPDLVHAEVLQKAIRHGRDYYAYVRDAKRGADRRRALNRLVLFGQKEYALQRTVESLRTRASGNTIAPNQPLKP